MIAPWDVFECGETYHLTGSDYLIDLGDFEIQLTAAWGELVVNDYREQPEVLWSGFAGDEDGDGKAETIRHVGPGYPGDAQGPAE